MIDSGMIGQVATCPYEILLRLIPATPKAFGAAGNAVF